MEQNNGNGGKRYWFALYTKPRHEFKAEQQLKGCGIEYFLPTVTRLKQWSDRKKKVKEPLFKSYIFIHANEKERLTALEQYAIVRTIYFDGKPAVIPDWQIENLRKMLEKNVEVFVKDALKVGTRVRIVSGPFKDIEGIVYKTTNQEQMLAVTIDLLRRSVVVQIPRDSLVEKV